MFQAFLDQLVGYLISLSPPWSFALLLFSVFLLEPHLFFEGGAREIWLPILIAFGPCRDAHAPGELVAAPYAVIVIVLCDTARERDPCQGHFEQQRTSPLSIVLRPCASGLQPPSQPQSTLPYARSEISMSRFSRGMLHDDVTLSIGSLDGAWTSTDPCYETTNAIVEVGSALTAGTPQDDEANRAHERGRRLSMKEIARSLTTTIRSSRWRVAAPVGRHFACLRRPLRHCALVGPESSCWACHPEVISSSRMRLFPHRRRADSAAWSACPSTSDDWQSADRRHLANWEAAYDLAATPVSAMHLAIAMEGTFIPTNIK